MRPRDTAAWRFPLALLLVLAAAAAGWSGAAAQEPEVLKGTVRAIGEEELVLKEVSFQDPTIPKQDVRILLDKETRFLYGTQQVPREEVTVGQIVLVRCTLVGPQRKALMVRIIGGKTGN